MQILLLGKKGVLWPVWACWVRLCLPRERGSCCRATWQRRPDPKDDGRTRLPAERTKQTGSLTWARSRRTTRPCTHLKFQVLGWTLPPGLQKRTTMTLSLRTLRTVKRSQWLLTFFFHCFIESVATHAIFTWHGSSLAANETAVQRVTHKEEQHTPPPSLDTVYVNVPMLAEAIQQ